MSESDSASKASTLKLNAAASEFVPGSYASKPAAAKTSAPVPNNQVPKNNGYNNNNRVQGQNNYNNNRNTRPNNMMPQPYYPAPAQLQVTAEQELYIFHMQSLAASQGLMYDPISHGMYGMAPNGMPILVVPSTHLPPMQDFIGAYAPVPVEGEQQGEVYTEEGEIIEGQETSEEAPEVATEEVAAPVVAEEPVAVAAAPAVPASTGKYVPPNRGAPAPAAVIPASVETVTAKAAALSISTEDEETPVDIEASTGDALRYPKQAILALFNSENVTIPATLREFFTAENFEIGSKDGSKFVRQPLPSVLQLAESGAAFYGGSQTPGRGKGSSNNLRGGASSSNLERSASSSSFGGHNNNRRNNNRDRDANREAGELVEGDEGFVPYDENNPAPEDGPRQNRKKNKNQNLPPAVYKSRFQLDASDPMAIVRKANAILNKLSITNFDKLSDEFMVLLQSDATTEDAMRRGVEALVTKAQMEENFCFIYADLCRKIIDTWSALEPDDNTFSTAAEEGEDGEAAPAPAEGEEAKSKELRTMGKIFKETLLQRCQSEFEFDHIAVLKEIRENAALTPEDRTEKEILLKKRITGHMRFIGELYMKDLIKANVIKACCLDVLIESVLEEELVCLCKLFQTIGARLEKYFQDKSRQKKNKSKNLQDIIPSYFERILQIGETHPSSRVRFMMKDLADMRANDWTARREEEKMVNLDKKAEAVQETQFKPVVSTPYISGDARAHSSASIAEVVVDEWSVVSGPAKKKSAAPSPVPPAAMSRSNSSAQMTRVNSSSNGNLSGMDKRRPGPGGPAPSAGPAGAGPRKDKPAGRGDARGDARAAPAAKDNKGPRNAPNRGNSVSPVPSEAAEAPVVTFTSDLAEITKKVRSAAKEYYRNGLVEEATLTFQEVNPLPTLMADVVKDLICQCVELSSEKDCVALVGLFAALRTVFVGGSSAPVLGPEQVKEGVLKFLHVVDELSIDVPKAGSLGGAIIGHLAAKELLSLEVFASIPDENDFSFSSRFADTVLLVVKEVAAQSGEEAAAAQYKAAGLDLAKNINAPPKQSAEEALAELAAKHGVAFILA